MARSRLAFGRRLGIFGACVSDRGATQQALLFRTAAALTLAFGAATTANADTIRFGLVTGNRGGASVSLSSDGFSFGANISPFANFGHDILCDPCGPGSTLSLAGVATGLDLIGSFTIGNVSFQFGSLSPEFGYAEIVSSGSVVLPQAVGQTRSVSAPVRLSVSAQTPCPVETFGFSGEGIATLFLGRKDGGPHDFFVTGYEFRFEETAPPVAEPATITLLGSGLIAAAIQRRRKQKHPQSEGL